MTTCKECGKETTKLYGDMCQGCYMYFRNGGKVYAPAEKGRVEYTEDGKVICHICGRAYKRLGSHIKESHGMTIKEYKEQFGLCAKAKTTEETYSSTMSKYAKKYHMDEQLKRTGKNTRFKKGDKTRKGKPVRLQEILEKIDRFNKES